LHDLIIPERVHRIPGPARLREETAGSQHAAGYGLILGERGGEAAALDTLRGHGCGWIDAHPAAAFQPHFRPGVRIGLPHDEVAAERVEFAALIARHDARRRPRSAREHGERGGEVLAEATARVEEEVVDRVQLQSRRLQRVEELLFAKHREYGLDERRVARDSTAHFASKGES